MQGVESEDDGNYCDNQPDPNPDNNALQFTVMARRFVNG